MTVRAGQNLIDLALAGYLSPEGVFELLSLNPSLSFEATPAVGSALVRTENNPAALDGPSLRRWRSEERPVATQAVEGQVAPAPALVTSLLLGLPSGQRPQAPESISAAAARTVTVSARQNPFDLALALSGSIEGLFALVAAGQLPLQGEPAPGAVVRAVSVLDGTTVRGLAQRGWVPATGSEVAGAAGGDFNNDFGADYA